MRIKYLAILISNVAFGSSSGSRAAGQSAQPCI